MKVPAFWRHPLAHVPHKNHIETMHCFFRIEVKLYGAVFLFRSSGLRTQGSFLVWTVWLTSSISTETVFFACCFRCSADIVIILISEFIHRSSATRWSDWSCSTCAPVNETANTKNYFIIFNLAINKKLRWKLITICASVADSLPSKHS